VPCIYLVRSTVAARIWDDSGVEFAFTTTYQEGIVSSRSLHRHIKPPCVSNHPTFGHDLPILPEISLPPGVEFFAIGDQTTPELAIRPPSLRHLLPYCHSHMQPPRIGQTGKAEWCNRIHSYDHWIEIQVVGGKWHRELEGARGLARRISRMVGDGG
jgi:hypothetical protein